MKILYNLGIILYMAAARLLSPLNPKAKLWSAGQGNWESLVREKVDINSVNIWIHCASLGEFEQGRPLIEAIRKTRPGYKIILTFFSPSGYEIRKNYSYADCVCYLPADTQRNALRFIDLVNPSAAIFVKYEFWDNYTLILEKKGIPLYLISGIFRKDQHFFSWYGGFFRKMLFRFSHIFVQEKSSQLLLKEIGYDKVTVAGDTRFDRVMQIAESSAQIQQIGQFRGNEKLFLAGSSWHQDEEIIARYINHHPDRMKWVFAPHEIHLSNIERLENLLTTSVVRFSKFTEKTVDARVMIIDNIGMLSSAYRYASMAAIGGGFGKGIHNILEAACWGIPVIFGPNYKKFREAVELIELGGAITFSDYGEFSAAIEKWLNDDICYRDCTEKAGNYVRENTGATRKIMAGITLKDINNPFS